MGMFDELDDVLGDGEVGAIGKIPAGEHKAEVTGVFPVEDKGRVDVKLKFLEFNTERTNYMYLKSAKGPEASKNALGYTTRQLKNAGFKHLKTGRDVKAAFNQLKGLVLTIDVSNREGSNYQNFFITGVVQREVEQLVDGDIPF